MLRNQLKNQDQNLKFSIYTQLNSWASTYDEHSLCNNSYNPLNTIEGIELTRTVDLWRI
jgi:hypothetical protein